MKQPLNFVSQMFKNPELPVKRFIWCVLFSVPGTTTLKGVSSIQHLQLTLVPYTLPEDSRLSTRSCRLWDILVPGYLYPPSAVFLSKSGHGFGDLFLTHTGCFFSSTRWSVSSTTNLCFKRRTKLQRSKTDCTSTQCALNASGSESPGPPSHHHISQV